MIEENGHISKESSIEDILYYLVEKTIGFPHGQICKHYVALNLLDALERVGYEISRELVQMISDTDDDAALDFLARR